MAIWVTSDLHLNHKNIIRMLSGFKEFKTIDEYNNYVIEQYNSVVGKDDLVYILGDFGFTPQNSLSEFARRLNGRKVLLIGNHDTLKDDAYKGMGFIDVIRKPMYYNNHIILSHIPTKEALDNPWVINVHGHLHRSKLDLSNFYNVNIDVNDFKPINIEVFEKIAEQTCPKWRWQKFGEEWYAKNEKKIK